MPGRQRQISPGNTGDHCSCIELVGSWRLNYLKGIRLEL